MPLRTRSMVTKGSTASSPIPKGQSLGNSSLALGVLQDQIKTLAQRVEFVGKRIKTSKTKVTWSFNVKQVCFTVELFDSKSSGKRRVRVNGHLAKEVSAKGATTLQFRNTGLSFEVAIGDKSPAKKGSKGNKAGEPDCVAASVYDLRVDGHSFAEIHTAMLAASRAEHALAQPPTAEEMLAPTVDNQHVAAAMALAADAADAADPAGGCERRESKSDTGARAASGKDEETATGGSVRVSNSSVRAPTGHCPGDDTVPDCLNLKMSEGLEENRMHADRYSKGVSSEDLDLGGHDHTAQKLSAFLGETETKTTASSTPSRRSSRHAPRSSSSLSSSSWSGRKRAGAVSNKPSIAGLETLGHHDDFYRQDEPAGPDLLTSPFSPFTPGHPRGSVASSFLSSTSTQFDSALSHFDSIVASPTTTTTTAAAAATPTTTTTTTTAASFASPPPRSIMSTGAGGTIPLVECVISPQAHNTAVVAAAAAAVLPINPFDTDAGVVDAETKKRTAAAAGAAAGGRGHGRHGGRTGEVMELEELRAENAVLKLRAENAALKAQVQAAPAVPVAGAYHAPAQQQYVIQQQYVMQQQHQHQHQQNMMHHHHHQQQHFMYMQQQRQSAPTLVSRAGPTAVSPNTRKGMDCAMLLKLNGMLALNRPSAATAQPVVSRP